MSSTKKQRPKHTNIQTDKKHHHQHPRLTYAFDNDVHDGLGDEVSLRLVDDLHVRVDQVADCLHLALQLWVHGGVVVLGLKQHMTQQVNR